MTNPKKQATDPDTPVDVLEKLARADVKLSRLVARNPSAGADLLRELGGSDDNVTLKRVATHPNTPADVLLNLALKYPEQLLKNPVFDLLLLEQPDSLHCIYTKEVTLSLLNRQQYHPGFLVYASSLEDEAVQLALLNDARTPEEIVERLKVEGVTWQVRDLANMHVALELTASKAEARFWEWMELRCWTDQSASLKDLECLDISDKRKKRFLLMMAGRLDRVGVSARQKLALSLDTDPGVLACLAGDPSKAIREAAFSNENLPKRLQELCGNRIPTRKEWITNRDLYADIVDEKLDEWCMSGLGLYVYLIIRYPESPPECVIQMLERGSIPVEPQIELLKTGRPQPEAVEVILGKLFAGGWYETNISIDLILGVLKHRGISADVFIEILKYLSNTWSRRRGEFEAKRDGFGQEIEETISEDVTSREILSRLSECGRLAECEEGLWQWIPDAVAENPRATTTILKRLSEWNLDYWDMNEFYASVAIHENAPKDLLLECAMGKHGRYALEYSMENPRLTGDMLHRIATDEECHDVHDWIPHSPNARPDTLTMLYENDSDSRWAIARNKNTDIEILYKLHQDGDEDVRWGVAENPNATEEILYNLSVDASDKVRKMAAKNSNATEKILAKLSKDHDMSVRRAVTENKNVTENILNILSKDTEGLVRYGVATNPSATKSMLSLLSSDSGSVIRSLVAEHHNTPISVLRTLSTDSDDNVRQAAEENLKRTLGQASFVE